MSGDLNKGSIPYIIIIYICIYKYAEYLLKEPLAGAVVGAAALPIIYFYTSIRRP